mmetsp:Transcript_126431/g.393497  ORF Transcript_126431/g.393497 Transcript_126431/m.393497 type:complete len:266 (-) Transcript_126431:779-1576(-)
MGRRGIDEAIVGHIVGGVARLLHLHEHLLGAPEVSVLAESLHQRVVGDDVDGHVGLLHLLHELLTTLHVARGDADVQHTIVRGHVDAHAGLAELRQDAEGPVHVLVTPSSADQRHVVLNVQARHLLGELPGEVGAAALHGELHEAAVHHAVRLEPIGADLVVEAAGLLVHAAIGVDLHQCTVDGDGHADARLGVLDDLLREAEELRLRAARQQADAEALADAEPGLLHVLPELESVRVAVQRAELQEGVVGAGGEVLLGLAGQLL